MSPSASNYDSIGNNDTLEGSNQFFDPNNPDLFASFCDIAHVVLVNIIQPPIMLFGIGGNLLNIIILSQDNSLIISPAIKFLISMSIMDLSGLTIGLLYTILEWCKYLSLILRTSFAYYSCYIEYALNDNFNQLYELSDNLEDMAGVKLTG